MSPKEKISKDGFPEDLQKQFILVEHRLWRVETIMAICIAAAGLIGSYLILFFSDRLWDSPGWLRLSLLSSGLAITIGAVFWWSYRWVLNKRDTRDIARLVQRRYRLLGDRLLGIVELANEEKRPSVFSPALYRAAIGQVAEEALKLDFKQTVSPRPARNRATITIALIILAVAGWIIIPEAGLNSLQRWGLPGAEISRHTLVRLDGFPNQRIVAKGEPFDVNGSIEYRSFWKPRTAFAQFRNNQPQTGSIKNGNINFKIPGQVEDGNLTVTVGDAKEAIKIRPLQRPAMRELLVEVKLPDYLNYPPQNETVQAGFLPVLRNSKIEFRGRVSRKLKQAQVTVDDLAAPMTVINESFYTNENIVTNTSNFAFTWLDEHNLTQAAAWQLSVEPIDDAPPRPDLSFQGRSMAILETEVLELKATVNDDYGIKAAGIAWRALGQAEETALKTVDSLTVSGNGTQDKEMSPEFFFSPAVLGINRDTTVELTVWATDYLPGREQSRTSPIQLHILGIEDHAEIVRQKLETVLQNLEEVSRAEENIAEDTRELVNSDNEKLSEAKTNDKIKNTADEQSDNADDLKDLVKEGANALMEAMKNPAFDEQTLRDWAQNLKSMDELADQQMKTAQSKLGQASQEGQSDKKKEKLAEALEDEEEALEELADLQEKVNKDLDNLQALTLAQRLRKLSKEELALRKKIKDIIQETIGLKPKDLPSRYSRANDRFTKSQGRTQEKAVELQGEISRFYERTAKGQYGEVSREMETEKTGESLSEIESQIDSNISMLAIRNLGDWASKFEGWAKKLEPPKQESEGDSQGAGQGGGEKKEDNLMKLLFSMLRLRESELRHQQQTTLIEEQKQDSEVYDKGVKRLLEMHADSMLELNRLQFENSEPSMLNPLQDTFDSMEITDNLLEKPQTDTATLTSQTETIRHISDVINLINEEIKRDQNQQGQSKSQQEMNFMMAMMAMKQQMGQGMQQGQTAGGSQAGGTTKRTATGLNGDSTGKKDSNRTISKGSGNSAKLPEEFRDALEGYFRAVEVIEEGELP